MALVLCTLCTKSRPYPLDLPISGRVPTIVGLDTLAGRQSKDLRAEPSILRPPAELDRELAVAGNPAAVVQRIRTELTREPQLVQAPAFQHRKHLLPTLRPVDEGQLELRRQMSDMLAISHPGKHRRQSIDGWIRN